MTHLDLFSGIGGFAIAAQAAGFETVAFCEYDQRCRTFLERTWGLPVEPDVRQLDGRKYRGVSLLTGGPPCQPASRAGKQGGEGDDRWLWPEALRVLAEAQPDWVVFENPLGIGDVGLDGILSEMERLGYEVQTFDIPACAVGSPQLRNRYWIVGCRVADADERGLQERRAEGRGSLSERDGQEQPNALPDSGKDGGMADAAGAGRKGTDSERASDGRCAERAARAWERFVWVPCADGKLRRAPDESLDVVNGLHRSILGAMGNSIVPQVAFEILKAIAQIIQG